MNWTARVLLHVGDVAFVQLPGGTLAVTDAQQLLQDGDHVAVHVLPIEATHDRGNPYMLGPYRVRNNGQAALLIHPSGMVPLLLRSDERLPEQVYRLITTEPAEMAEGAEPPAPPIKDLDCPCRSTFVSPIETFLRYQAHCARKTRTPTP